MGKAKGQSFKIMNEYYNVTFTGGRVDIRDFKSIYLEVKFWVKAGTENPDVKTKKLFKNCKQIIHQENKNFFFTDKLISVYDFPDVYSVNNHSFTKFEFTLFRRPMTEILDVILKLNETVDSIYHEIFEEDTEILKRGNK